MRKIITINTKSLFSGTSGDDNLVGTGANDFLSGGDGNDTLTGGGGNDTLDGGNGNDRLISNFGGSSLLIGGDGNDIIIANGADSVSGGNGDDTILNDFDLASNATISGDQGNDSIYGIHLLFGGEGNDLLYVSTEDASATLNGGEGDDILNAFYFNITGVSHLNGDAGDDEINGDIGQSIIDGGSGNDLIYAEDGNDTISGSSGNDAIYAGDGADALSGGIGSDILFGGAGADRFTFETAATSTVVTPDLIGDFSGTQGDKIALQDLIPGTLSFIGTGNFTGAGNEVRYHHTADNLYTVVQVDLDPGFVITHGTAAQRSVNIFDPGDPVPIVVQSPIELEITLAGHIDLNAGDFIL